MPDVHKRIALQYTNSTLPNHTSTLPFYITANIKVIMETLDAIKSRRSIRAFKKNEIPEQILHKVLEAAQWAPSAGNLQTTRLIVVTDKKKKAMMAKLIYEQDFISQAPVAIIVCTETDALKRQFGAKGDRLFSIQNSAAVCQNILLAAHDQGLAGCWVAPIGESKLRREFRIPDHVDIHAILSIGYAAEWPRPPARIPLSDIVYFTEWGEHEMGESLWPLEESLPRLAKKVVKKAKKKIARKRR